MKLLFIYPGLDPAYPIQLGALSAYVKRGGHETRLFAPVLKDWRVPGYTMARLGEALYGFRPDFVAFCGYESALAWIKQFSEAIKGHFEKAAPRIILGGYYPSACPYDAIRLWHIDIICQGEGEIPLLTLLNEPHRTDIPGLWFKDGYGVPIANPVSNIPFEMDSLPFPDRFDNHQKIIDSDSGVVKVMAGRGCVHSCTYCQAPNLRAIASPPGTRKVEYLRMRSPQNVVAEILRLREHYQFLKVGFHDDIFWGGKFNKEWLREFVRLWKTEIRLPFYCAARVEQFDDETFDLLRDSGCYLLLIGVESGDGVFRKKILKRHMSDDMIRWVVDKARRRGISAWTFNMVGMLDEGYRSMLATAWLNWRLSPDFAMCSVWYPLQGTSMGDEAHRRELVDVKAAGRVTSYARQSVLKYSWGKKRFLTLVRWLNILSACRRRLFWRLVWERIR